MTNQTPNKIVALAGGVGGAKLVYGLAQLVPPEALTVIVNTGDDFEHLGLHISPDLDTVMYTLAGVANPVTGWGVKDESWDMMAAMARYGGPTWFQLGDRDLATHLLRTKWLRDGYPYNWVTRELSRRLGVRCTILPMSEHPICTMIQTEQDELAFQEYFVKEKWQPVATGIRFEGADTAQPSREVISAIREADAIIICPSNPLISIDPILSMPSLRRIIAASRAPKIGVSPIVGGEAIKGPAAKLMAELGLEVSPVGVARHLQDVLTGFVIDHVDQAHQDALTDMGLRTLVTATVMQTPSDRIRLADQVLEFAGRQR
ncbi:MAG: 2-phospho-L-lactate transferase [Anaerolineae bacterium]|nr:2-phospho-L-lactate transferase [Anaerolineae bacterium]